MLPLPCLSFLQKKKKKIFFNLIVLSLWFDSYLNIGGYPLNVGYKNWFSVVEDVSEESFSSC